MFGEWRWKIRGMARDALAMWYGMRDARVPLAAKLTALASVWYLVMPMDLIPDVIPVIGWLDDLAMVPLVVYLAQRMIPFDTMERLREQADIRLIRWGPKLKLWLIIFAVGWLLLAALGGFLLVRRGFEAHERHDTVESITKAIQEHDV